MLESYSILIHPGELGIKILCFANEDVELLFTEWDLNPCFSKSQTVMLHHFKSLEILLKGKAIWFI